MRTLMRAGMFVLWLSVLAGQLPALSLAANTSSLDPVRTNQDGVWYVNARTMVNPADDKVSFWSTVVPRKDGVYYEVLGMVLEKTRKNPGQLEYIQILHEADCSMGTLDSKIVTFYDKQDRIVHTVNRPESARLIAEFGHAEDGLLAAVCGQQLAGVTE